MRTFDPEECPYVEDIRYNDETEEEEYLNQGDWYNEEEFVQLLDEFNYWQEWTGDIEGLHE